MDEYREEEFLDKIYKWFLITGAIFGACYYLLSQVSRYENKIIFTAISLMATTVFLILIKYISKSKEANFYRKRYKEELQRQPTGRKHVKQEE